jgi:hypothetical protein
VDAETLTRIEEILKGTSLKKGTTYIERFFFNFNSIFRFASTSFGLQYHWAKMNCTR